MRRSGGRKRKTAISNVYKSEQHLSIMNISRDFFPPFHSLPADGHRDATSRKMKRLEKENGGPLIEDRSAGRGTA